MGIISAFRRWAGKPARSFDEVDFMVTRRLPIPDLDGTQTFAEFTADRGKDGRWSVASRNNSRMVTAGGELSKKSIDNVFKKHTNNENASQSLNFDTAFLILRDLEEAHLKYNNTQPSEEPAYHYMAAYRLLPQQFKEGLDDIFFDRLKRKDILPSKLRIATPASAGKPAEPPLPN